LPMSGIRLIEERDEKKPLAIFWKCESGA
jgi:hypothetical protein